MEETEKVLKLGKREIRCIPRIPMGVLFDLAEAMNSGKEIEAIVGMNRMLKTVVVKEDLALLSEALHDVEEPVEFDELNTAIGDLMKQYGTKRPLAPSSRSAGGSGKTGGTQKVVSLSRGTVREGEKSSQGGTSIAS